MKTNRGTVLISVLWIVLVVSLVSFSLASAVRLEANTSQFSFESERAFFMAQGAAEIIFNAFSKDQPIPEKSPIRQDKGEYIFPFESGEARVRFESKAGLISLNEASDKTLAALFDYLEVDRETRNRLVDSVLDWRDSDDIRHLYGAEVDDYDNAPGQFPRPRNAAFTGVDELLLVKNMTAELFFGRVIVDGVTGTYRRIPGVRELVAVRPGRDVVDPNRASLDVLRALPGMTTQTALELIRERLEKPFADIDDLNTRVPQLLLSDTANYLSFEDGGPTELVSTATIAASGVSRTVRLLFRREEKTEVLRFTPYLYRKTMVTIKDRWRLE